MPIPLRPLCHGRTKKNPPRGGFLQGGSTSALRQGTVPKAASLRADVGGAPVRATGMVKGAGMIEPKKGAMLAFLATHASLSPRLARTLAWDLAERSFNRITVDGDTSTNDSFVVVATGRAPLRLTEEHDPDYWTLCDALTPLAEDLAQRVVRDAEGATKFVTIRVQGTLRERCEAIARRTTPAVPTLWIG